MRAAAAGHALDRHFRRVPKGAAGDLLAREGVEELSARLGAKLSPRRLDAAMAAMGAGESGEVDLEEFRAWWKQHGGAKDNARLVALIRDYRMREPSYLAAMKARGVPDVGAFLAQAEAMPAAEQAAAAELLPASLYVGDLHPGIGHISESILTLITH